MTRFLCFSMTRITCFSMTRLLCLSMTRITCFSMTQITCSSMTRILCLSMTRNLCLSMTRILCVLRTTAFALIGLKTLNVPMYNVIKRLTPMTVLVLKVRRPELECIHTHAEGLMQACFHTTSHTTTQRHTPQVWCVRATHQCARQGQA